MRWRGSLVLMCGLISGCLVSFDGYRSGLETGGTGQGANAGDASGGKSTGGKANGGQSSAGTDSGGDAGDQPIEGGESGSAGNPPAGSDLIEDWELFYGLAQQLGLSLRLSSSYSWGPAASEGPTPLDMQRKPTTDELYELLCKGSRVPLETVKRAGRGALYPDESIVVAPKDAGWDGKLDVGNAYLLGELAEIAALAPEQSSRVAYRLISRRLQDIYNSSGRDIPRLTRKWSYNPAFMNPADLGREGLRAGDVVEIASDYERILGVVEDDPSVRAGAISMPHAFGGLPEEAHAVRALGSNTGALTPVDRDYDPISGIPRMSAIPVNVKKVVGM